MAQIELRNISRSFPGNDSTLKIYSSDKSSEKGFKISDFNLTVPDRKTLAIIGPSGCGKTTLLRIIAGLDKPDKGGVFFDSVDMTLRPAKDRHIGMVFQNYALYPHLKNRTNILSFFLFKKQSPELDKEAEEKLKTTSELLGVDISYLLDRNPTSLSGGEKQRVALGRCITRDPAVFLLDEPFSNLDAKLRIKYRVELKRLLVKFGVTAVYVTHDQSEAFLLGDLIAIMKDGKIMQTGTFDELYNRPCCRFVAEFMNPEPETQALNVIDASLLPGGKTGQVAGFRPSDAVIRSEGGILTALVAEVRPSMAKNQVLLRLDLQGKDIFIRKDANTIPPVPGERVGFDLLRYFLFDSLTGERIDQE